MATVTSRAFRPRGKSKPASLLPLIDMANHSFEPNCKIRLDSTNTIHMETISRVAKGDALWINYGDLSNDLLLLDYGFFLKNNLHDRIALQFELSLLQVSPLCLKQVLIFFFVSSSTDCCPPTMQQAALV